MGTDGMCYSLQSRDLIADSIETVMGAQWYDANISIPGCDKNMPGCLMAMGRLNRPSLMIYGGTIKPGHLRTDEKLDIVSAFQCYGEFLAGTIDDEDGKRSSTKLSGRGACGGMYTANTMASAIEAMGMSLPYSSSIPAEDPAKLDECFRAGAAIRMLLERDIKPRDIMTRAAFENAMVVVMALGGSTNAVLHLIAMARAVDVPLTIDDFQTVSDRDAVSWPISSPAASTCMEDLHNVGGTPAVMKYLLEKGLLDGDCLTVTGKTLAENLHDLPGLSRGPAIIHPLENPIKATGHIQILRGNLAPEGAVAKITGKEGLRFSGPAKVYDSEEDMLAAPGAQGNHKGRRRHHPLRRPQGRARHAGNAHAHLGHHGRRTRAGRGADHRRPLLGRIARLHRRPRHAGSPGRRADRPGPERRPDHDRRRDEPNRRRLVRRGTGQHDEPHGKPRPTNSPAARSTSTSRT